MKLQNLFLFSAGIRRLLSFLKRLFAALLRVLVLICKGFPRLKIDSILLNDVGLVSNGLVIIQWRARNVLWTMINGRRLKHNVCQSVFYASETPYTITIKIRGLFRSYRQVFEISPSVKIEFPSPARAAVEAIVIKSPEIRVPVFSPSLAAVSFTPIIAVPEIKFPVFQIEKSHEQRILQNA